MKKLNVYLKYCYGIEELDHSFNFDCKVISVYVPNGVMKTSFAKAFSDYSTDKDSEDIICPENKSSKKITTEDGTDLDREKVFVIMSYDESYKFKKMSALLVNQELKQQYDEILSTISNLKIMFLKALKKYSGIPQKNIEDEMLTVFAKRDFSELIKYLAEMIDDTDFQEYREIQYNILFNAKTENFLEDEDVVRQIDEYVSTYDKLISQSAILSPEFNHTNANAIVKNLSQNKFFKAKHSVNLMTSDGMKTIDDPKVLKDRVTVEINKVFSDKLLQTQFNAFDQNMKNAELRELRDCLQQYKFIRSELNDIGNLKKKLWLSYMQGERSAILEITEEYTREEGRINSIIERANKEKTQWESVINIFNQRFHVPFILQLENRREAILNTKAPSLKYQYELSKDRRRAVEESKLLSVLSQGERRAYYILNVIFEIEVRKKSQPESILIFDDIADSFDYKNKYAIIEYLNDIAQTENFKLLILTHNYDFHRTVCSRLDMNRECKLNAVREKNQIRIEKEKYQRNPFMYWRDNLNNDDAILIATIPFVRNLCEYTGDNPNYLLLTSLLHMKLDTEQITIEIISDVFKKVIDREITSHASSDKIYDLIITKAEEISCNYTTSMELEGKIVLSIAIRLLAEKYIITTLNGSAFIEQISDKRNQTFRLMEEFKLRFPGHRDSAVLQKVMLMTPENIHLNSFMYEPILDMDHLHLVDLFHEVKLLT
ncbi:MAG: hypothetical protein K8R90_02170 [Candidatus Cloacimonetes bacterium]|nr:hypothetical protein [Candidatus Cloacimonadota bacterium]